jgi:hypothetical protein
MRATFASSLNVTSAALVLGFAGQWMIGICDGKTAVPSSALLWSVYFWVVLLAFTINQMALLEEAQRLLLQAVRPILSIKRVLSGALLITQYSDLGE